MAICGRCGRHKPCNFVTAGKADLCLLFAPGGLRLRPLREAASARCSLERRSRVRAAAIGPGLDEEPARDAGDQRRLISPPGVGARLCADCAGVAPLARCSSCGIEDRLYKNGRCVHCALAERAASLLGGPRPGLVGVYDAIVAARQPYSAHNWLRSAVAASILADIASGDLPLTHDALDAHPLPEPLGSCASCWWPRICWKPGTKL